MAKRKQQRPRRGNSGMDLRLNPENRVCPRFDALSIAQHSVADRGEMGVRVVDNCAEENQK